MEENIFDKYVRQHLKGIKTYDAVNPITSLGKSSSIDIIKLNGNENPYGCSEYAKKALSLMDSFHIYPDPNQKEIRLALSKYTGASFSKIIAGSGCDEIIDLLIRLLLEPGDNVLDCTPTFGMYSFSTRVCGGTVKSISRDSNFEVVAEDVIKSIDDKTKIVFIASPNNPTGNWTPERQIRKILDTGIMLVLDETYFEFCKTSLIDLTNQYENLIILRSFSKWAGLAGLRIGYGIMSEDLIKYLMDIKPPYNVNVAAEVALLASLKDSTNLLSKVNLIVDERKRFEVNLSKFNNVKVHPSSGNFVLCEFNSNQGIKVYKELEKLGIFVRYFNEPRLTDCIRISIGTTTEMNKLTEALSKIL